MKTRQSSRKIRPSAGTGTPIAGSSGANQASRTTASSGMRTRGSTRKGRYPRRPNPGDDDVSGSAEAAALQRSTRPSTRKSTRRNQSTKANSPSESGSSLLKPVRGRRQSNRVANRAHKKIAECPPERSVGDAVVEAEDINRNLNISEEEEFQHGAGAGAGVGVGVGVGAEMDAETIRTESEDKDAGAGTSARVGAEMEAEMSRTASDKKESGNNIVGGDDDDDGSGASSSESGGSAGATPSAGGNRGGVGAKSTVRSTGADGSVRKKKHTVDDTSDSEVDSPGRDGSGGSPNSNKGGAESTGGIKVRASSIGSSSSGDFTSPSPAKTNRKMSTSRTSPKKTMSVDFGGKKEVSDSNPSQGTSPRKQIVSRKSIESGVQARTQPNADSMGRKPTEGKSLEPSFLSASAPASKSESSAAAASADVNGSVGASSSDANNTVRSASAKRKRGGTPSLSAAATAASVQKSKSATEQTPNNDDGNKAGVQLNAKRTKKSRKSLSCEDTSIPSSSDDEDGGEDGDEDGHEDGDGELFSNQLHKFRPPCWLDSEPAPKAATVLLLQRFGFTAEKVPETEDKHGRSEYRVEVPPEDELGLDRTFAVLVDGIESIVTCPENIPPGELVPFRPFDSFHTVPVKFRTSRHGLILRKIPGQKLVQLVGVVEGSEGSKEKLVVALANKKYFLRAIGPRPAPNSTESALEALEMSRYPLTLVFGPPGPPEDVSLDYPTSKESDPPPMPPSSEETVRPGHAKSRNASHVAKQNGGVEMNSGSGGGKLVDPGQMPESRLLPQISLPRPRHNGSYTVQFHEQTTGMNLRTSNGPDYKWTVVKIREGTEAASKPISTGDRVIGVGRCMIGVNTKKTVDVLHLIRNTKRPISITFCRSEGENPATPMNERQGDTPHLSSQSVVVVPKLMNDGTSSFLDLEIEIDDVEDCDYIRLSHEGSSRRLQTAPNLPCYPFFRSFATIIDVIPKGNCGFDCLGLGLQILGCLEVATVPGTTGAMRKALFDHAKECRGRFLNMSGLRHIYCPTGDENWWKVNVLDHIYSEGTEYGIQADYRQWMQAHPVLPIFADLFYTTVVLYDVNRSGGMTMTTFSPQGRSRTRKVVVSSQDHVFEPPPDDSLAIVFYSSHFYLLRWDEKKEAPTQPFDTQSIPPRPNKTRDVPRQTHRISEASGLGRSSTGTKAETGHDINGNPIPGPVANNTPTSHVADDFTLRSNLSDDDEDEGEGKAEGQGERERGYPLTKDLEYVRPFFRQKKVHEHVVQNPYYEVGDVPSGFDWNNKQAIIDRFQPRAVKKGSNHVAVEGRRVPAKTKDAPGCGRRQIPMAILMDAVVPNDPAASNQNRIHLLNLWYFALTREQQKEFFELLSTMYFAAPTVHNKPLAASDALRQAQLDRAKTQGLAATKNPIIVTLASDRQERVAEMVARSFSHQVAMPEKRRKKSDPVRSNAQLNDKVARRAKEILEKRFREYHQCTRVGPGADVTGQSIAFCVIRENVPIPLPRGGKRRRGIGENQELMDHWLTVVFCKTEEEGRREIGAEKLAEYEQMGEVVFSASFGHSPYMAKQKRKRLLPKEMRVDEVAENAKKLRPTNENVGQGEEEMPSLPGATIEALPPRTPIHHDMRPILHHKTPQSATYASFMMI